MKSFILAMLLSFIAGALCSELWLLFNDDETEPAATQSTPLASALAAPAVASECHGSWRCNAGSVLL
jgi:hypothetical protein